MFEDLFSRGTLEMSTSPLFVQATGSANWGDIGFNKILSGVAVLLFLINISNILNLLGPLTRSMLRAKSGEDLEHSIRLSRSRNISLICIFLPFCLILCRYDIYHPSYFSGLTPEMRTLVTIGAVLIFIMLKFLTAALVPHRRMDSDSYNAACRSVFNFMLILFFFMLASLGIAILFRFSYGFTRDVLIGEIVFFWALSLRRSFHILRSLCNLFTTILYLCALEILPSAILVLSAVSV